MQNKEEPYRGYMLSWQEPPRTSAGYEININPTDRAKFSRIKEMPPNRSLEMASAAARVYVDELLDDA
jgi:hypothetical protein